MIDTALEKASQMHPTLAGSDSFCAFWLGGHCYALDVSYVGAIFTLDMLTTVPGAPAAILGLYNLRGLILTLVDLAQTLNLPASGMHAEKLSTCEVLELKSDNLRAAVPVDRIETIQPFRRARRISSNLATEHPALAEVLEFTAKSTVLATLLNGAYVLERIGELRMKRNAVDPRVGGLDAPHSNHWKIEKGI